MIKNNHIQNTVHKVAGDLWSNVLKMPDVENIYLYNKRWDSRRALIQQQWGSELIYTSTILGDREAQSVLTRCVLNKNMLIRPNEQILI